MEYNLQEAPNHLMNLFQRNRTTVTHQNNKLRKEISNNLYTSFDTVKGEIESS